MSRIYVDFNRLQKIGESCEAVSSKMDGIKEGFQQTVRKLDWDVRFQSDINNTALQLSRKLQDYNRVLKVYKSFVELAYKKYLELDSVEFKLKIEAGQTNIFDETNGYGEIKAICHIHFDDEVASFKTDGTTIYSQENRLLVYLHEKGIDADVSCSSSTKMSADIVRNTLESGAVVKLSLGKGTQLCDENGKVQQTLGGGHAVLITDITDDGRYVISSWGEKYYVDPSRVYIDQKTGENRSYINSYLTLDVIYK